jgi:hypothetical protein
MVPTQVRVWLLTLPLLMGTTPVVADDAGRIQFAFGDVRVIDEQGRERRGRRGEMVGEGDTIRTAVRSAAQIKMLDGGALAIRSQTEVRIDDYRFKDNVEHDRSFLSLLGGTVRSISGLVGRARRANYRIATTTATIGIRGSDADIGFDPANGLVAVRTNVGGHTLTPNAAGLLLPTLETNVGQTATALPGQPPRFATEFPFSISMPLAVGPRNARRDEGLHRSPRARTAGQRSHGSALELGSTPRHNKHDTSVTSEEHNPDTVSSSTEFNSDGSSDDGGPRVRPGVHKPDDHIPEAILYGISGSNIDTAPNDRSLSAINAAEASGIARRHQQPSL